MRVEQVRMSYVGDLSVNHYLGRRRDGGYYVKPEVKNWKEELGWLLNSLHLEEWHLPLEIKCSGYFKDDRSSPDLSNLSKIILDTIEDTTGINDKNMRWHDGIRDVGHTKEPYLLITIKEGEIKGEENANTL